jgi:hypothetical protein
MALIDRVNLANDGVFQARCLASASAAALAIINEAVGPHTPRRQQYAVAVLGPQGHLFAPSIARAVAAANPALAETFASGGQAAIVDAQIDAAVASAWNALAGVVSS